VIFLVVFWGEYIGNTGKFNNNRVNSAKRKREDVMKKLIILVLLLMVSFFSNNNANAGNNNPGSEFVVYLTNEVAIAYSETPELFHRYVDFTKLIKVDIGRPIARVDEYGVREMVKPIWVIADVTMVESRPYDHSGTYKKRYVTRVQFHFLYRFNERSDAKAIVKKETVKFASR